MENEMNRTSLLVTAAVVAFAAATGASLAQQERVQQQERGAPAEKVAPQNAPGVHNQGPNSHLGETPQNRGRSETTGQAPREDRQSQPNERNSEQERGRTGQPPRSERNERNHTTGQAPRGDRLDRAPEQNRTTGQAPREDRTNRSSDQNRFDQERERSDRTTGQGAAGTRSDVTVNLTPEKRTRIHEVIVNERNAPRVRSPNFSVSVGTRVPRTVRFAALPRTIVDIEPEWRGFEYFMIADRMVIIDPRSMEIVAIVDV
jgi:Protein of unknown function (DUF1236)